jgi:hypothetical protein
MKAKKLSLLLATPLLIVGGIYLYFFASPHRFVESPIAQESLQHLRASGSGAAWASSPAETAFEYLFWWPQLDRPKRAKLDISVSYRSPEEAVVTIIDNDTQDDSVSRTCDRLTLHRDSGLWIPVRHQSAWQGRGRFGWTTQSAL